MGDIPDIFEWPFVISLIIGRDFLFQWLLFWCCPETAYLQYTTEPCYSSFVDATSRLSVSLLLSGRVVR